MNMTRQQKYRLIRQAEPGELRRLAELADSCAWRQTYHIQPHAGLLNDPNGFAYYGGEYHLFYQWFPLGTDHGMKYWYHVVSSDLAHWRDAGIGLEPGGPYDSHGAYSGSAIEKDGLLHLMYTGNTRDGEWIRHPYQCLAVMDANGSIVKRELPVIAEVPEGYTDHFRDPKVWRDGDSYLCVIGAQRADLTGAAVLYRSPDLVDWKFEGEISTSLPDFGYMWECPDYFELNGAGVLLLCPQGLEPDGERFRNVYQSGFLLGSPLNAATREFEHGEFVELDRGFDFYAPQTTEGPDGRRLLVGWMGLPDLEYPTDGKGWAHCLTLPRELSVRAGRLVQRPAAGLESLRGEERSFSAVLNDERRAFEGAEGNAYELRCTIEPSEASGGGVFGIEFRTGETERTVLTYVAGRRAVALDRSRSGAPVAPEYGTTRSCAVEGDNGRTIEFRLFVDVSSVEVFVGDGEEVFTARIFPDPASTGISFFADGGSAAFEASYWPYGGGAIPRGLPADIIDYGKVTP
ncbi:glycoside hydrolase family 32 protein [Saccharibacillus alkalitolerans]|uniref:Sucrose-6-phosphate hydrolase n=1 Tax=Saccharibacillus alkalitolerans TaxID=2705290 RepID=A0ABX0F7J3_9BACL|nr:sucrose-6-phosphate hydrolase [Saccharibacillus alkalitolerans]NGZ75900.1 sucrose-6-phosphate hydrolase [Saccharibacillus alkalitolerans]